MLKLTMLRSFVVPVVMRRSFARQVAGAVKTTTNLNSKFRPLTDQQKGQVMEESRQLDQLETFQDLTQFLERAIDLSHTSKQLLFAKIGLLCKNKSKKDYGEKLEKRPEFVALLKNIGDNFDGRDYTPVGRQ